MSEKSVVVVGAALIHSDPDLVAALEAERGVAPGNPGIDWFDAEVRRRVDRIFVAKHRSTAVNLAEWELPCFPVTAGDEKATLQESFSKVFTLSIEAEAPIVEPPRDIHDWRPFEGLDLNADDKVDIAAGTDFDAVLKMYWARFSTPVIGLPTGFSFSSDSKYDEAMWVPLNDLSAGSPWRPTEQMTVPEIVDWYLNDPEWKRMVVSDM